MTISRHELPLLPGSQNPNELTNTATDLCRNAVAGDHVMHAQRFREQFSHANKHHPALCEHALCAGFMQATVCSMAHLKLKAYSRSLMVENNVVPSLRITSFLFVFESFVKHVGAHSGYEKASNRTFQTAVFCHKSTHSSYKHQKGFYVFFKELG